MISLPEFPPETRFYKHTGTPVVHYAILPDRNTYVWHPDRGLVRVAPLDETGASTSTKKAFKADAIVRGARQS